MTKRTMPTRLLATLIAFLAAVLFLSHFAFTLEKKIENAAGTKTTKTAKVRKHSLQQAQEYMKRFNHEKSGS